MTTRSARQHTRLLLPTLAAGLATALAAVGAVPTGVPAGAVQPETARPAAAAAQEAARTDVPVLASPGAVQAGE